MQKDQDDPSWRKEKATKTLLFSTRKWFIESTCSTLMLVHMWKWNWKSIYIKR